MRVHLVHAHPDQDPQGRPRVDRITYEICALEALRDQLCCKEVWVAGANRYRNPDEDLPADFDAQRAADYQALNLPLDAGAFNLLNCRIERRNEMLNNFI